MRPDVAGCWHHERTTFHFHARCAALTDELVAAELRTWSA